MSRKQTSRSIPVLRPIDANTRQRLTERFVTALSVKRASRRVWAETQEFFLEHWSATDAISIGAVRDCMDQLEEAIDNESRRYRIEEVAQRIGLAWSDVLAAVPPCGEKHA